MAYERKQQRDNSGSLKKNDRRRPDKDDPTLKGSAVIDGREYWVSAWVKDGQWGKWISLAFDPKVEARRETYSRQREEDRREPLDDEIPF